MDTFNCPKCGSECDRESVDVGVGTIYGPWGCSNCCWSEDPRYDCSEGDSIAHREAATQGRYVDCFGVSHSVERIADKAERFGIPREAVHDAFRVEDGEPR